MQQTIERYRRHTEDNETNKPIQQNLQHLKAESANMLKTVEDLEVSRNKHIFMKLTTANMTTSSSHFLSLRSTSQALFLHLEPPMLLETKGVEPASFLVQHLNVFGILGIQHLLMHLEIWMILLQWCTCLQC
ncbi:hypothetical protein Gotur_015043 [Gossypium turneri]